MIKLQTPVADTKCKVGISYGDKTMLLGSCFTDNIGKTLKDYGFDVCVNPFGTLYNPASIAGAVRRLHSRTPFTEEDCVQMGSGSELFCSFSHHTSFARSTEEEFLANANSEFEKACDFFKDCNKVIITLGTAWCFRHLGKRIVANCLKRNAAEFSRELLDLPAAEKLLEETSALCGSKQMIFTVSPIRHLADGAHGNQTSKSTLLLAVDSLIRRQSPVCGTSDRQDCQAEFREPAEHKPRIDYFPAYEIMMDELRDYRFYAEDMVHPSQQAVNYILERFLGWALPASEFPRLEENIRVFKRSQHRRFHG